MVDLEIEQIALVSKNLQKREQGSSLNMLLIYGSLCSGCDESSNCAGKRLGFIWDVGNGSGRYLERVLSEQLRDSQGTVRWAPRTQLEVMLYSFVRST